MGTRADFYIGEGEAAEWLGSVAWDGYEWDQDKDSSLRTAKDDGAFREAVKMIGSGRDDFTAPDDGWPWPWDDSRTTDYAYCHTPEGLKVFCFGRPVADDDEHNGPKAAFPNMKDKKNVQIGGQRSGLIVIGC